MPDVRFDPLGGRWVIPAPCRSHRPRVAVPGAKCPFCPGNEHLTPPEIARVGAADHRWQVRVFDNRFPIVVGAHEVVVLSPDHRRSLAELDDEQVRDVLTVLGDRARHHAADGRAYTQAFVNHGSGSGASVTHPHAQLVALDLEPPALATEAEQLVADGRCILCDAAFDPGDLTVVDVGGAVAWCPWWSATAFELLVCARHHRPRFEDAGDELPAVATALRQALNRLHRAKGDPGYNLAVHSLPAGAGRDFHWHVHVWPRLQQDGGFERATGLAVETVDPAAAAAALRWVSQPG